ncbi:MAG TPA: helicase [Porphyromonadaceae bacterium]|nr:helicase [Porphyromonadaceae bacterium]
MQEFFDNINYKVIDDLKVSISEGSRLSIAAATFSIYAFQELKEQLLNIEELRFIFTEPSFLQEKGKLERRQFYIPRIDRERTLYGSPFELKLRNRLTQKAIATECAEWIKDKVTFKSNVTDDKMNGYIHVRGKEECAYLPINGFTTTDLGCEKGNNILNFVTKLDAANSKALLQSFDEIWNDSKRFSDVTEQVAESISNIYKENAPEFIYFMTLYNVFREFLDDISEDVLPNEATGFKQSVVWNKLYNFQRDAALAIINKLEKYNGCILADSVGLGKTFTALSVIKYYESRNKNVLVLCPKKLENNWNTYRNNYRDNPLAQDRLRYDVLFHTDLSRDKGQSNGIDLEHINWGNYDLVVIDESHNFRNGGNVTTDRDGNVRENRYARLMNRVMRAGVKTKVLMLSATPVNNRFADLQNQLALAYEGDDAQIDDKLDTDKPINQIFAQAQKAFKDWSDLSQGDRTTARLLEMLSFDFFELLDSLTIARSRKHIEQYYDTADIGKFPERLAPVSRRPQLTDLPNAVKFQDIYEAVTNLNLAIYSPSIFIQPSKLDKYLTPAELEEFGKGARGARNGRESGIRRLMSINLLKRLESSVHSFRETLNRVRAYIATTIDAINEFEAILAKKRIGEPEDNQAGKKVKNFDFSEILDFDEQEDPVFVGRRGAEIDLADMDYVSWRKWLASDLDSLDKLLLMLKDISPEHDSKLQMLIGDIRDKFEHPINNGNRKVIIFTAFSDTAKYIYDNIAEPIRERGMNTAIVTGDTVRSTLKLPRNERLDFNKVLTLFSPVSKSKDALYPNLNAEIDVLVATDCISEGQNLQDCDYLVNYDIHWNPVRIIQRFGRIDRIGSRNAQIQLVNYWPDMELDEYINLKGRVEARMSAGILAAGGEDNPITPEEQEDLEYRRSQLQRLHNEVIDIEDMNTGVSIMDLGLNEFRLDLLEYMKQNHDIEHTPSGLHAVVPATESTPPGVIYILKNRNPEFNIDRRNRLHPFYLVYISSPIRNEELGMRNGEAMRNYELGMRNGEAMRNEELGMRNEDGTSIPNSSLHIPNSEPIPHSSLVIDHLHPKELLDCMRKLCRGKSEPVADLCRQFNRETRDGQRMDKYSKLLGDAISSLIQVKDQSDLGAFLDGDADPFGNKIKGLDDFELICFLIIK